MADSESISIEHFSTFNGLLRLEADWQRLVSAKKDPLPFLSFTWVTNWWCSYAKQKCRKNKLHILVVKKDTRVIGIAPFFITSPKFFPLIRAVRLLGADANITEMRFVLCAQQHEYLVYHAIQRHFYQRFRRWDYLEWMGAMEKDLSIIDFQNVSNFEMIPGFKLKVPGSLEEFKKRLRKNAKNDIRHSYNSLKRDGLEFSFQAYTRPDEINAVLPQFFRLHKERADLRNTIPHPDHFREQVDQDFVKKVTLEHAKKGRSGIHTILLNGKIVAARIIFIQDDEVYLYYSGLDTNYRKYGVGTLLFMESLKLVIADGYKRLHLSFGEDRSKSRWLPSRKDYYKLQTINPRLYSKIIFHFFQNLKSLGKFTTL